MGMFRYGDAPISCTYHLVSMPFYEQTADLSKEKKK